MPHFYIPPENIHGKLFRITGEDVHYLSAVRRYATGDKLKLFDGTGKTFIGVIKTIGENEIAGEVIMSAEQDNSGINVHLFQAVPKGERFDWLVEKSAELGVTKLTPLITERSVIKEISVQKYERWQRLSKAASQQCGRGTLLEIDNPAGFAEILNKIVSLSDTLNIIPWEAENTKTLAEVYKSRHNILSVNIFVGPEGGFSVKEIELAEKAGIIPITLGKRILRSETAGLLSTILVLNQACEYENK
jgi:16S rRNA (uracil1498-N3)-methyltransferase